MWFTLSALKVDVIFLTHEIICDCENLYKESNFNTTPQVDAQAGNYSVVQYDQAPSYIA